MKEYKVDVYFGEKPNANTGGTMKAYKIDLSRYTGLEREVISKAVQEKAFELGYRWGDGPSHTPRYTNSAYLFLWNDATLAYTFETGPAYYQRNEKQAITVSDFLALKSAKDDEKPAYTFKPFDKVLVRDSKDCEWLPSMFFKMGGRGHYETLWGEPWNQCIPYEGNEELIGTNKEPKE